MPRGKSAATSEGSEETTTQSVEQIDSGSSDPVATGTGEGTDDVELMPESEVGDDIADGAASMGFAPDKVPFNASGFMMNIKGKEYLPVSGRILWFRNDYPKGCIVPTCVEHNKEKQYAIFRTEIFDGSGNMLAAATKMEDVRGFPDYLEKAECVPLSTEMLTAQGWKTYDQLQIGETVAAYDQNTGQLKWTPLVDVKTYENQSTVRLYNNKGFEVICTPDHKWPVKYGCNYKGKRYNYDTLRETNKLTTGDALVVGAPAESIGESELNVTPQQAFVMGMLITDGSMRYTGKHISGYVCQSKVKNVDIIRDTFSGIPMRESVAPPYTRTFPSSGKTYDCLASYRWYIAAGYLHDLHDAFEIYNETELPRTIARLSPEARNAMYDAMMLAEGDAKNCFAQMPGRNDWVIDVWQQLVALRGGMVSKPAIRQYGIWVANAKRGKNVYASNLKTEDAGKMDVWCPQTAYGTFVARFGNGVVTITGNTGSVGRALGYCGYGTLGALEENPNRPADAPVSRGGYSGGGGGGGYSGGGGGGRGYSNQSRPNNGGGGGGNSIPGVSTGMKQEGRTCPSCKTNVIPPGWERKQKNDGVPEDQITCVQCNRKNAVS